MLYTKTFYAMKVYYPQMENSHWRFKCDLLLYVKKLLFSFGRLKMGYFSHFRLPCQVSVVIRKNASGYFCTYVNVLSLHEKIGCVHF